ncbi:hypothetical protein LOAG_15951, partial [Loa loa]
MMLELVLSIIVVPGGDALLFPYARMRKHKLCCIDVSALEGYEGLLPVVVYSLSSQQLANSIDQEIKRLLGVKTLEFIVLYKDIRN